MAGLGRSQGSKYGFAALLGTLRALVGFGNPQALDRLRSGQTGGFPLAKKYVRTQNVSKATGRSDANNFERYNWDGPGAKMPHVTVTRMDTKEDRNRRRVNAVMFASMLKKRLTLSYDLRSRTSDVANA